MDRVSRRLPVVAGNKVRLPCMAHTADMKCGIYEDRPAVCASYFCEVARAVAAGRIPFDEAEKMTARLKESFRSLRAKIPGGGNLREDIARFVVETPEWRHDHADLLLEIAFFLELVDRFVVAAE